MPTPDRHESGVLCPRFFVLRFRTTGRTVGPVAKGSETRDRILDTAFRLAAREGLAGPSLAAPPGKPRLSQSGLFPPFASKGELAPPTPPGASGRFTRKVKPPA